MLVIQDPTNLQSTYLLESLLDALRSAEELAGAFAFASSAGVRLFTQDDSFRHVAHNYPVDLVVGVDAVTNINALESLTAVANEFPKVKVRAFMNPRPASLFHPKFCWTRNKSGGHLITGSGNLTEGGLLGNWEAYTIQELDLGSIAAVQSTWMKWTTQHAAALLPLDDAEVWKLASENNVLAREGDLPTLVAPRRPAAIPEEPTAGQVARARDEEPATTQALADTAKVLIAEIPRGSDRWNQVNFHFEDFVNFFGAQEGSHRLFVFRHVNANGTMADYERNRPPVAVKSRNFRFELAAGSGKNYPTVGRPIGVYIRVATRTFFYRLLFPDDPEFSTVDDLLRSHAGAPGNKMRTVRMTVADLRREWPNAPFWKLPSTA